MGEIADEYDYIRSMQQEEENSGPAGMRALPEGERLQLIDSLKTKWDEVNGTYQRSSVLSLASLDTIGKVKRKEMYEAQLAQIERDIEKLSKDVVYVAAEYQELYQIRWHADEGRVVRQFWNNVNAQRHS